MRTEVAFVLSSVPFYVLAVVVAHAFDRVVPVPDDRRQNWSEALESLRGFAAYVVFCAHVTMYFGSIAPDRQASSFLGAFGVIIFFMLTGHLFWGQIATGRFNANTFFGKRVKRLVPLAVVMITIVTVSDWLAQGAPRPTWEQLLAAAKNYGFGFVGVHDVFGPEMYLRINTIWSLRWEWLFYLCLPILAYLKTLPRASLFGAYLVFVFYDPADLFRGVETEASFVLAFYLGILSTYVPRLDAKVPVVGSAANLAALGCLLVFAVVMAVQLFGPGALEPKIRKAPFVLIASLFFFACVLVKHAPPAFMGHRAVLLVGKVSYSLYLWQLFINYHGVRALQPLIGLDSMWSYALTMTAMTAAVTCVSVLSYRYVEWPFLRPAERVDLVNPEHALGRP